MGRCTVRTLTGPGPKNCRLNRYGGAPIGIAVDTARSHLYWTDAVGRLQRANLDASGIHNVARGLGRPGDMVISNSIMEPAGTTPTTPTPTPTASKSKYDLNGDGVVDNMDAGLVSQALNTTNAKYDVNDDGVVNFLDLLLVFDNRDADAAGAPPLLGMKLTAGTGRRHRGTDRSVNRNRRSVPCGTQDADLSPATPCDGTSRKDAVACQLSESIQS